MKNHFTESFPYIVPFQPYFNSLVGRVSQLAHPVLADYTNGLARVFIDFVSFTICNCHRIALKAEIHDQFFQQLLLIIQSIVTFLERKAAKLYVFSKSFVLKFSVKLQ